MIWPKLPAPAQTPLVRRRAVGPERFTLCEEVEVSLSRNSGYEPKILQRSLAFIKCIAIRIGGLVMTYHVVVSWALPTTRATDESDRLLMTRDGGSYGDSDAPDDSSWTSSYRRRPSLFQRIWAAASTKVHGAGGHPHPVHLLLLPSLMRCRQLGRQRKQPLHSLVSQAARQDAGRRRSDAVA